MRYRLGGMGRLGGRVMLEGYLDPWRWSIVDLQSSN